MFLQFLTILGWKNKYATHRGTILNQSPKNKFRVDARRNKLTLFLVQHVRIGTQQRFWMELMQGHPISYFIGMVISNWSTIQHIFWVNIWYFMISNYILMNELWWIINYNKPMLHFYVDSPAPSLHGNNSEIGAKTVNIKM